MTSRKLRLKQMAETSRGARKALALAEHPDNLLSTVQVGITLISVLTGVFGGEAIGLADRRLAPGRAGRTPPSTPAPIGIGTAVTLITAASVIFGELIPKRLALTNPEGIASGRGHSRWTGSRARPSRWSPRWARSTAACCACSASATTPAAPSAKRKSACW